jgi:hypothetical protein
MSMRDDLADRVKHLQQRRAQIDAERTTELARLDAQITGLSDLLANWDKASLDQALSAAEAAGLRIRVDA